MFWRGVLITLGLALGIREYLLEARYIPSGSMLPGLQLQDRLLVVLDVARLLSIGPLSRGRA